jgi:hypothetical protein
VKLVAAALLLCTTWAAPRAQAQNPATMMPEESAAKAHQILGQLIQALGGQAYLNVRQSDCSGRLAEFAHNGDLNGYVRFKDYWLLPDKNRTDYAKKGNIVDLYAGNEGWTMDRGGVHEEPATAVADFQQQVQTDADNLLRFRLHEEGLEFRYGGPDIVDLKQVDWVEIVDREQRTFRIAVDRKTHLMVRCVVITRDESTRERTEQTTFYSDYHMQDGVMTALQLTRLRNGRRVFQAFYESCNYHPNFPPELFTKAGLEKRYDEVASKKDKERAAREREKDKASDKNQN